ncbi:hypothetical protein JZ751_006412 [Albula glossodonta]|uniref:Uncharacterized protein n=1 Tax=Albula glossodonta TaxID=121402 RepID=A0A8T2N3R8_9TELE|nr:hypothetical protein JZ751_006412 [Albula glossodonta]
MEIHLNLATDTSAQPVILQQKLAEECAEALSFGPPELEAVGASAVIAAPESCPVKSSALTSHQASCFLDRQGSVQPAGLMVWPPRCHWLGQLYPHSSDAHSQERVMKPREIAKECKTLLRQTMLRARRLAQGGPWWCVFFSCPCGISWVLTEHVREVQLLTTPRFSQGEGLRQSYVKYSQQDRGLMDAALCNVLSSRLSKAAV